MSVPQDKLMQLMGGARSAGTPVPPTSGLPQPTPDAETPPMGAPMSTPEPKMGSKEASMINLGMAQDLLEQSLASIGSNTEEGKSILSAISTLNKILGPRKNKTNELQQSEIIQMLQSLPQAGGATPESRAMAAAPLPGMTPPGGLPSFPPPTGGMPPPSPPAGGVPPPPM